jgi:hypothetical protein
VNAERLKIVDGQWGKNAERVLDELLKLENLLPKQSASLENLQGAII